MGSSVLDLFAEDVYALEIGPRGDMLGDWARLDIDRDGIAGAVWPRVRFVRHATAADLMRVRPTEAGADGVDRIDPHALGLVEVCWALLPPTQVDPDERQLGLLWRGERLINDPSLSFLDERFFNAAGKPTPGSLDIVTGGVLWFDVWYAAQTSIVHDGWTLGDEIADCAASWDAYNAERPNTEVSYLNTPARGMPKAKGLPLLPRRIRVTVEIERPTEIKRRTRLAANVEPDANQIPVDDETRLPPQGSMILVGEEWMKVGMAGRGTVTVMRAQRGTRRMAHDSGILVHYGNAMTREIPVPVVREDWDL
jgi:hypothetical protein